MRRIGAERPIIALKEGNLKGIFVDTQAQSAMMYTTEKVSDRETQA
jgi:hypothetical protein